MVRYSVYYEKLTTAKSTLFRGNSPILHPSIFDGFVKSPTSCVALHPSSLQRTVSTPHSSGFARLEFGAFYFAIEF
jgi:hypothetical protein